MKADIMNKLSREAGLEVGSELIVHRMFQPVSYWKQESHKYTPSA